MLSWTSDPSPTAASKLDTTSMRVTGKLSLLAVLVTTAVTVLHGQGDLDTFMQQVLARRDDNWKKQQQYVLDERETLDVEGPARVRVLGMRRDYTWYIRDGFFVRSPVKYDGVTIAEADRRKYEADYLTRAKEREKRAAERSGRATPVAPNDAPPDLDGLLRQSEQPEFISSAYFLRFKFDAGRYALVGRETLEGRSVLRIEYYPTNLFRESAREERERENRDRESRRQERPRSDRERATESQLDRLMNKTSKVTLWVDPATHQILKYTFDDLGWDFFPASWLLRISDVTATMTVAEMFPDVWLPRDIQMHVGMTFAAGPAAFNYKVEYHDYRKAGVEATIIVPGDR